MIDKDYFKDNFDYKKSELFKHSVALWQAGFLNTDKDTARLSLVKDILANDFFIAPYKDNSPLVAFNNPESRKNKTKEKPVIDSRGIFINWITMDNFLDKLALLKTHSALEQENFYKEIIGFKITKLYRNPLTAHRGDEVPLIWNYISCKFNFPENIAEIEDKIHDCSMFNEYITGKMLSEKSNKFAVGAIIAAVVICIVQLVAPFVQNLIMK